MTEGQNENHRVAILFAGSLSRCQSAVALLLCDA